MDKPEQNLFDWSIWDNCQAGLWDVYNRLCVDWGEEHERYSFSTPNLCQSMQESGDCCLDRGTDQLNLLGQDALKCMFVS